MKRATERKIGDRGATKLARDKIFEVAADLFYRKGIRAIGVETIVKHPPVLILESPRGRVAISNHDDEDNAALIQSEVEALS